MQISGVRHVGLVFALCLCAASANAQDVGLVKLQWAAGSNGSIESNPPIVFLDFGLGMRLDEVRRIIENDQSYSKSEFRYETQVSYSFNRYKGEKIGIEFPQFEEVLFIQLPTQGTKWDKLYLYFTPDTSGPVIYAMRRTARTDNETIGMKPFFDSVFARFGDASIFSPMTNQGRWDEVKQVSYTWDNSGKTVAPEICTPPEVGNENGGDDFTFPFSRSFDLRNSERAEERVSDGCGRMALFAVNLSDSDNVVYSFSSFAYDPRIHLKSLKLNIDIANAGIEQAKRNVDEIEAGKGKAAPKL